MSVLLRLTAFVSAESLYLLKATCGSLEVLSLLFSTICPVLHVSIPASVISARGKRFVPRKKRQKPTLLLPTNQGPSYNPPPLAPIQDGQKKYPLVRDLRPGRDVTRPIENAPGPLPRRTRYPTRRKKVPVENVGIGCVTNVKTNHCGARA